MKAHYHMGGHQIDNILVSQDDKRRVKDCKVMPRLVESDHLSAQAEIDFTDGSSAPIKEERVKGGMSATDSNKDRTKKQKNKKRAANRRQKEKRTKMLVNFARLKDETKKAKYIEDYTVAVQNDTVSKTAYEFIVSGCRVARKCLLEREGHSESWYEKRREMLDALRAEREGWRSVE